MSLVRYFEELCSAILQVKADKIIANAKEEAVKVKALAAEQCEKGTADAHSQAERVRVTT